MIAVSNAEIQKAGGLEAWIRKETQNPDLRVSTTPPAPQEKPKVTTRKPDTLLGFQGERMNKLEAEYAVHLERRRMAGDICLWKFGQFKLRMADRTWYAPDFFVINKAGISEFHETKGFMRDDANVKLKTCAELYREFNFYLVRKLKGTWDIRAVK